MTLSVECLGEGTDIDSLLVTNPYCPKKPFDIREEVSLRTVLEMDNYVKTHSDV